MRRKDKKDGMNREMKPSSQWIHYLMMEKKEANFAKLASHIINIHLQLIFDKLVSYCDKKKIIIRPVLGLSYVIIQYKVKFLLKKWNMYLKMGLHSYYTIIL